MDKKNIGLCCAALLTGGLSIATMAADNSDMAMISAGTFQMGSDKTDARQNGPEYGNAKPWYVDEHPQHAVELPSFYLDRYEVTNAQYREFVARTNRNPPANWLKSGYVLSLRQKDLSHVDNQHLRALAAKVFKIDADANKLDHTELLKVIQERVAAHDPLPVTEVSWDDAHDYCQWAGKRLPTEAEWEKGARGQAASEFPWGNDWKAGISNSGDEAWDDGVAPVGSYKEDKSTYGVMDMGGNVSEWVADWYQPYPGSQETSNDFGEKFRVIRGGAWGREGHYSLHLFQRAAYRFYLQPNSTLDDVGFRCAKNSSGTVAHTSEEP
jgi:formylglycine-generating enzyme required for sulfatase activity